LYILQWKLSIKESVFYDVEIKRMTESSPMPVVWLLATSFVKKAFG
jgi:hypothetical protein